MRAIVAAVVLGVGALVATVPVDAHHAFAAEFDIDKPISLTGTVTKLEWTNPHIWIHMDLKDSTGKVVTWRAEGGAPNALYRLGWKKGSLTVGQEVTVNGYLARDGSPTANANSIKLPDGTVFGAASSAPAKAQGEPSRY
jgi:uncharacterized protein DUF6152